MGEILFLSHRIPFPPDRGDKIRSHNVLKALAALGPVHVATFADDEHDFASEEALADLAASHILVRRGKSLPLAAIEALGSCKALSLAAFHDRKLQASKIAWLLGFRDVSAFTHACKRWTGKTPSQIRTAGVY